MAGTLYLGVKGRAVVGSCGRGGGIALVPNLSKNDGGGRGEMVGVKRKRFTSSNLFLSLESGTYVGRGCGMLFVFVVVLSQSLRVWWCYL